MRIAERQACEPGITYSLYIPTSQYATHVAVDAKRLDGRTRAARAQGRAARDELLAAALRVFASRGYRQAGVDEIAAAAGYSEGALYWHFSGKADLLDALLEEHIDAPTREMVALLGSAPPDRDMSIEASRE